MSRLNYLVTLYGRAKKLVTDPDTAAYMNNDRDIEICGDLCDDDIVKTIIKERSQSSQPALMEQAATDASPAPEPVENVTYAEADAAITLLKRFFAQTAASAATLQSLSVLEDAHARATLVHLHQQLINPFILAFPPADPVQEDSSLTPLSPPP
jgi:hypothetical protein